VVVHFTVPVPGFVQQRVVCACASVASKVSAMAMIVFIFTLKVWCEKEFEKTNNILLDR
jgi:hypothetical protein